MARIRTIKPEFWTSEQVVSCVIEARLLFIGMWNFADDNGVHPKSYQRIQMEVFPGDAYRIDKIIEWIDQLLAAALVIEYTVSDKEYWLITGFKRHQRIDRPTYKFPLPGSVDDTSSNTRGVEVDVSERAGQHLPDESLHHQPRNGMDSNVMDRNVMESSISKVQDETLPISIDNSKSMASQIFKYWQVVLNHPRAKLDKTREKKIIAAQKIGYSVEELKQAIDGCLKSTFHMGQNDLKQKYDDISLIFRDAAHIEQFMGYALDASPSNEIGKIVSQIDQMVTGAINV